MTRALRLTRDLRGSVAVEFALLAPAFFLLLLGVFQVGIGMQNYNALRNTSADVARYAMVQYATGNRLSTAQLQSYAVAVGRSAPYLLDNASLTASVVPAATQRVPGASELTLRVSYQIDSLIPGLGLHGPSITFSRPMFVAST